MNTPIVQASTPEVQALLDPSYDPYHPLYRYGPWFSNFSALEYTASLKRLDVMYARIKNQDDKDALWDAMCSLRHERDEHRKTVGQECAPWFNNSAFTSSEPWFTQKLEGERVSRPRAPLIELLLDNRDDEELCDWLKRAKVGDTLHTGGGAAPRCEVRRVA